MKKIFITLLCLLASSVFAINKCESFYKKQQYESAFLVCHKMATSGNAVAQRVLSRMYIYGQGVGKNEESGFEWCDRAANKGDLKAQLNLSMMYYSGIGTEQNYQNAFYWANNAAKRNSVDAQAFLSVMYMTGNGVSEDKNKAFYWMNKAAKSGDLQAQFNLGSFYENAIGTFRSCINAVDWYKKAASKNNIAAQVNLSGIYDTGCDDIKADPTLHFYWLKKVATNPKCNLDQNSSNAVDINITKSDNGSVSSASNSTKQVCTIAQYNVATAYENGGVVKQNIGEAIKIYTKLANQGHVPSQTELGLLYFMQSDYKNAGYWLTIAADQGDDSAKSLLSVIYSIKNKNIVKARAIVESSAMSGDSTAQDAMGISYMVEHNYYQAMYWFNKSALQGDVFAKNTLERLQKLTESANLK